MPSAWSSSSIERSVGAAIAQIASAFGGKIRLAAIANRTEPHSAARDAAEYLRSGRFGDVFDPNTGAVQARVQLATEAEVDRFAALWADLAARRRAA